MRLTDLTGATFGRLTVLGHSKRPGRRTYWDCRCSCGASSTVRADHLRSGATVSCGCFLSAAAVARTAQHGTRCTNPRNPAWADYGGRGIAVCDRWRDYAAFLADMGERPSSELTIDRVDNDRGYEPGNCRWATWTQQANNRRKARR